MCARRVLSHHLTHEGLLLVAREVRGHSKVTWRAAQGMVRRPHFHGDLPAWLHRTVPDVLENQLTLWALEVVVAFQDVRADAFDVGKGLVDKAFHTLEKRSAIMSEVHTTTGK